MLARLANDGVPVAYHKDGVAPKGQAPTALAAGGPLAPTASADSTTSHSVTTSTDKDAANLGNTAGSNIGWSAVPGARRYEAGSTVPKTGLPGGARPGADGSTPLSAQPHGLDDAAQSTTSAETEDVSTVADVAKNPPPPPSRCPPPSSPPPNALSRDPASYNERFYAQYEALLKQQGPHAHHPAQHHYAQSHANPAPPPQVPLYLDSQTDAPTQHGGTIMAPPHGASPYGAAPAAVSVAAAPGLAASAGKAAAAFSSSHGVSNHVNGAFEASLPPGRREQIAGEIAELVGTVGELAELARLFSQRIVTQHQLERMHKCIFDEIVSALPSVGLHPNPPNNGRTINESPNGVVLTLPPGLVSLVAEERFFRMFTFRVLAAAAKEEVLLPNYTRIWRGVRDALRVDAHLARTVCGEEVQRLYGEVVMNGGHTGSHSVPITYDAVYRLRVHLDREGILRL